MVSLAISQAMESVDKMQGLEEKLLWFARIKVIEIAIHSRASNNHLNAFIQLLKIIKSNAFIFHRLKTQRNGYSSPGLYCQEYVKKARKKEF